MTWDRYKLQLRSQLNIAINIVFDTVDIFGHLNLTVRDLGNYFSECIFSVYPMTRI